MITDFYKDCEIFITGGSGVVGKAAIEKLLRSTDVKKIYILLRGKKGASIEQRMEKLKDALIFRVLKKEKPDALNKLVAIPGDAVLPNLGITPYYAKMMENVSIVIHCAATVRFNETLKIAMKVNVGGTCEAIKFAEKLKNLKGYLHVSTFFSNPYLETVESKIYPAPVDWKLFMKLVDENSDDLIDTLTKKIIVGFPNTYCFTKNLAEQVVNEYCGRLPIAIYRPSIVAFAVKEPEPGIPPSLMGAMGMFVMIGTGLLKTLYLKPDVQLDLSPLDMSTIALLATAYMAAKQYENGKVKMTEVPVTLGSSYKLLHHSHKELAEIVQKEGIWIENAFNKNFLIPWIYFKDIKYLNYTLTFTHQIFPALLVDGVLKLAGRQPVLMGLIRKEYTSLQVMEPFLFNSYKSDFYTKLPQIMAETNGTSFDMSEAFEIWEKNMIAVLRNAVMKIREILLKEDPATLPRAKKILKTKIYLYNAIRAYVLFRFCLVFTTVSCSWMSNSTNFWRESTESLQT